MASELDDIFADDNGDSDLPAPAAGSALDDDDAGELDGIFDDADEGNEDDAAVDAGRGVGREDTGAGASRAALSAAAAGSGARPPRHDPGRGASGAGGRFSVPGSSVVDPDAASVGSAGRFSAMTGGSAQWDGQVLRRAIGGASAAASPALTASSAPAGAGRLAEELAETFPDAVLVARACGEGRGRRSIPPGLRSRAWRVLLVGSGALSGEGESVRLHGAAPAPAPSGSGDGTLGAEAEDAAEDAADMAGCDASLVSAAGAAAASALGCRLGPGLAALTAAVVSAAAHDMDAASMGAVAASLAQAFAPAAAWPEGGEGPGRAWPCADGTGTAAEEAWWRSLEDEEEDEHGWEGEEEAEEAEEGAEKAGAAAEEAEEGAEKAGAAAEEAEAGAADGADGAALRAAVGRGGAVGRGRASLLARRRARGAARQCGLVRGLVHHADPELGSHLDDVRGGWAAPKSGGGCLPDCWGDALLCGRGGLSGEAALSVLDGAAAMTVAGAELLWREALGPGRVAAAAEVTGEGRRAEEARAAAALAAAEAGAVAAGLRPADADATDTAAAPAFEADEEEDADDDVDLWAAAGMPSSPAAADTASAGFSPSSPSSSSSSSPHAVSPPRGLPRVRPSLDAALLPAALAAAVLLAARPALLALGPVSTGGSAMDVLTAKLRTAPRLATRDTKPDDGGGGGGDDASPDDVTAEQAPPPATATALWAAAADILRQAPTSAALQAMQAWAELSGVPLRAVGGWALPERSDDARREAASAAASLTRRLGGLPAAGADDASAEAAAVAAAVAAAGLPGSGPVGAWMAAGDAASLGAAGAWLLSPSPCQWTSARRRAVASLRSASLPAVPPPVPGFPAPLGGFALLLRADEAAEALARGSARDRARLGLRGEARLRTVRGGHRTVVLDVRPVSFRARGRFGAAFHVDAGSLPADDEGARELGRAAARGGAADQAEAEPDAGPASPGRARSESVVARDVAAAQAEAGVPLADAIAALLPARGVAHVAVMGVGASRLVGFYPHDKVGPAVAKDDARVRSAVTALRAAGFPLVSVVDGGYAAVLRRVRRGGASSRVVGLDPAGCPVRRHAAVVTHARARRAAAIAARSSRLALGPTAAARAVEAGRRAASAVGAASSTLADRVSAGASVLGARIRTAVAPPQEPAAPAAAAAAPADKPAGAGAGASAAQAVAGGWRALAGSVASGATAVRARVAEAAAARRASAASAGEEPAATGGGGGGGAAGVAAAGRRAAAGFRGFMGRVAAAVEGSGDRPGWRDGASSAGHGETAETAEPAPVSRFAIDDDDDEKEEEEEGDGSKGPAAGGGGGAETPEGAGSASGAGPASSGFGPLAAGPAPPLGERVMASLAPGAAVSLDELRSRVGSDAAVLRFEGRPVVLLSRHRLVLAETADDGGLTVSLNVHVTELVRARYKGSAGVTLVLRGREEGDGERRVVEADEKALVGALVDTLRGHRA